MRIDNALDPALSYFPLAIVTLLGYCDDLGPGLHPTGYMRGIGDRIVVEDGSVQYCDGVNKWKPLGLADNFLILPLGQAFERTSMGDPFFQDPRYTLSLHPYDNYIL